MDIGQIACSNLFNKDKEEELFKVKLLLQSFIYLIYL